MIISSLLLRLRVRIKTMPTFPFQPSSKIIRTTWTTLRLVIKAAELACEGLPIPGAQGSITALLAILRSFEQASTNEGLVSQLTQHVSSLLTEVIIPTQSALQEAGDTVERDLANILTGLGEYVVINVRHTDSVSD